MKKKKLILIISFCSVGLAIASFIVLLAFNNMSQSDPETQDLISPEAAYDDAGAEHGNALQQQSGTQTGISPLPQAPPQDPAQDYSQDISLIDFKDQGGQFELPVNGATGWAARNHPLYDEPQTSANVLMTLTPGQGFVILEEHGDWWHVRLSSDAVGWVRHNGCFINLPDIIPSIIYNITNAQASMKRSAGYDIPNISGHKLYDAWSFNARLGRSEFAVPALYSMSKKIAMVQSEAMANGDTIIMHEAFRPRETQQKVVSNFRYLIYTNDEVNAAINTPPWSMGAFIATSLSDHQRGAAIDVSLARIVSVDTRTAGSYTYTHITEFEEYDMPSPMHELSPRSASYRIASGSGAARLRAYCVDTVGLRPVSSEWWHFSDFESTQIASANGISGAFFIGTVHSVLPDSDENTVITFSMGLPHVNDPPELPEELSDEERLETYIEELISEMSLYDQISQLFIVPLYSEAPGHQHMSSNNPSVFKAGGYIASADAIAHTEYPFILGETPQAVPFLFIDGEEGMLFKPLTADNPDQPGYRFTDYPFSDHACYYYSLTQIVQEGAGLAFIRHVPHPLLIEHEPGDQSVPDDNVINDVSDDDADDYADDYADEETDYLTAIPDSSDNLPECLPWHCYATVLRENPAFNAIIITPYLSSGFTADDLSHAETAVMALTSGFDMIFLPSRYEEAAEGVQQALQEGAIEYERIIETLTHVIKTKIILGLIPYAA